jgi:hypothetical protein
MNRSYVISALYAQLRILDSTCFVVGAPPKFVAALARIPLRKFCEKILDPYSSVREYIARASPPSLAPPNDAKKMGGYVFFGYLEKKRPGLLDFRAVGSKWQTVHGWLRHGGRLED